jgi:crossover junction endodeoxyribonuclease RusA
MTRLKLPWPPSSLSGHAKGNGRWKKIADTKKCREWARLATLEVRPVAPATGDIAISFLFVPPNRRGDRTNFPNRLKPYIDGIADAMGVNDSRFLPSYAFADPVPGGMIVVEIGA